MSSLQQCDRMTDGLLLGLQRGVNWLFLSTSCRLGRKNMKGYFKSFVISNILFTFAPNSKYKRLNNSYD